VKKFNLPHIGYDNSTLYQSAKTFFQAIESVRVSSGETVTKIGIEGASFGSFGRHSDIGESLGRLLYLFEDNNYPTPSRPAPTSIKKFATGSGKALKADMILAWSKSTGETVRMTKMSKLLSKIDEKSPWSDIADAYWIMKWVEVN
jgi:hypothetical protein